jgi:hypothetical protein
VAFAWRWTARLCYPPAATLCASSATANGENREPNPLILINFCCNVWKMVCLGISSRWHSAIAFGWQNCCICAFLTVSIGPLCSNFHFL